LYRKAAEKDYAPAQANLGYMYANGRGVPADAKEALRWYRASADKGLVAAELSLGMMYLHGLGVAQDVAGALTWLRKAASHGSAAARAQIATSYTDASKAALDPELGTTRQSDKDVRLGDTPPQSPAKADTTSDHSSTIPLMLTQ
jgi:uncharacterized protein